MELPEQWAWMDGYTIGVIGGPLDDNPHDPDAHEVLYDAWAMGWHDANSEEEVA